jgi:F-type H+-transporting ATPase subunit gamma
MPANKQALRRRIRSVKATKKITSAMELIAASKLQKQKNLMEANRLFSSTLHSTLNKVLSRATLDDVKFLKEQPGKKLILVFVSDMGLCGAYNSNILNYLNNHPDDQYIYMVVGSKGQIWFRRHESQLIMRLPQSDNLSYSQLSKLGDKATRLFESGEISSFQVLYTKFVNSMTFEPSLIQLLPLKKEVLVKEEPMHQDLILEPNPEELIGQLMPMYMNSLLYSLWLESKTSEQAARRLAMDNATDNAQDIIEELVLKYNQSRQAAITQEITEIVSGAEAL